MEKIFDIATNISTPLMLAGFFAAAFFFIARQVIKANIFPQLTKQLSGDIIKLIIHRLFILALIAMILGFTGYVIGQFNPMKNVSTEVKEHYAEPSDDLIKLILSEISAINFAPKPEVKNLTLNFKVIPKSKDKFVPLKTKGDFIVIDSTGREKKYAFDVNFDDEGIKPQVISTLILDGYLPKSEYQAILRSNNYTARCVVYYDSDIMPTKVKYKTDVITLDKTSIKDLSNDTGN
jgi:hypothetical protein